MDESIAATNEPLSRNLVLNSLVAWLLLSSQEKTLPKCHEDF